VANFADGRQLGLLRAALGLTRDLGGRTALIESALHRAEQARASARARSHAARR
jgi:hypothetical protein